MIDAPFAATSVARYATPNKPTTMLSSGLYSSHSPGRSGASFGTTIVSYVTPMSAMLRAWLSAGAE